MLTRTQVQVRPVHPSEAGYVVDSVFGALSEESRRLRFHVPMPRLPTSFRDQLARIDGCGHVAVAAWVDGVPVGVGRVVRIAGNDAEMAVAVADVWQGRGLGRSILGELIDRAVGLGYQRLIADVLVENSAMMALLCDFFPDAQTTRSRGVAHIIASLDSSAPPSAARLPAQRAAEVTLPAVVGAASGRSVR